MTDPGPASLVELRFSQSLVADPERARDAFGERAAEWLGASVPSPTPGVRRYLTDLSLPVRAGGPHMEFKKAAFVDIGSVTTNGDSCEIAISWRSSTLAPLFPVFSGLLTVASNEIRLEGYYAPPGGDLGFVIDKAFLNIAARGTARWFLDRVVRVLDAVPVEVDPEPGRLAPGRPSQEHSGAA